MDLLADVYNASMDYDAIVVGGGHAGIEAALALSRLGHETLMITQSLDAIGRLSCNPAIGGLSKGNIVREVDALGGEMANLIDESMIQFRILNRRRGPAVQAPRAQADKFLYAALAKQRVELQKGLSLFQDTVVDVLLQDNERAVCGVLTERGHQITAKRVVITTGTFMDGKIFIGDFTAASGRLGEPAAMGLGSALREKGFDLGRLKTGTPARVAASSVDFSKLEEQPGDENLQPFSFFRNLVNRPNVSCWVTYTNEKTHQIIRDNLTKSPLYAGKIVGVGPRYCPSIEDKVVRFPERDRHQIFIEPEGFESEELYLNGISSSLPETVQRDFLRTLPGLERVHVMRPGYAVEYDFVRPTQLKATLESKAVTGLYFAGQTNGTSGYEEAACQGLVAGMNASLSLSGEPPLILDRSEAYTGVLIDDLITMGTEEPYRMFTSRAEYRLSLRHDNCDIRLFEKSRKSGLLGEEKLERIRRRMSQIEEIEELVRQRRIKQAELSLLPVVAEAGKTFAKLLCMPELEIGHLLVIDPALGEFEGDSLETAALNIRYEGYIRRQEIQVRRFKKMEKMLIPEDFDYDGVDGISTESRQKFKMIKPRSVGQAGRISGVRSSDLAVLMVSLQRRG